MTPITPAFAEATNTVRELCRPVAADLAEVERILKAELSSRYPYVDEIVRYGCLLGGKRLRPMLLLLTAKSVGDVTREHLVLGAVVEMIHTATLVHDDVLDEADFRRHLPTVNSRWDSEASILLGDFLFTHAFYLASTLDVAAACRMIGRSTNVVCEGELRQKGCEGNFTIGEAEYLEIVSAKTAELCACSCQLGSYFAGATEEVIDCLTSFGRYLGIAFQITDDLLDVVGDEALVGKSLGTDLKQLKPTLPILRSIQVASESDRQEMLSILLDEQQTLRQSIFPYLQRYGALEYTRDRAGEFAEQARRRLDILPPSEARNTLGKLCDFVVGRKF